MRLGYAAAVVLVLALLAGCAAGHQALSPAGEYAAGQTVRLANGGSLIVPGGWVMHLDTPGALVAASPADTGKLGGSLSTSQTPALGSASVTVFGPKAGYREWVAGFEAAAATTRDNPANQARGTTTKVPLTLGDETSSTAYVATHAGVPKATEVYMALERTGYPPAIIAATIENLPATWRASGEKGGLPALLLVFLRYSAR
jgi:hypothetical protein